MTSKKSNSKGSLKNELSSGAINSRLANRPIAIIGMSALFPDAPNLHQYWDNIINKLDSIIEVPEDRWKVEDYFDANPDSPDKSYCKRGGFLPEVDFNPMEFGIPPNILEVTDSTQLLGLLVAKSAMEDAGYGDADLDTRDATGCILGVTAGLKLLGSLSSRLQYPIWKKVLMKSGISESDTGEIIERIKKAYVRWEENSFPGLLGNVIAGRIANRLNLGGTNCTVDAACASSFSAMKMAISDLLEYRSDMMITGGVDADNSPLMYMCFSKTPAFTKGENPRPFDEQSGGVMIGEGMGMIILKRLEDAERDGDKVYAVIKGVGTSSDGKFKSIYAPRSGGQAKALIKAYEDADVDRLSIGLLEAHGTGTAAGDAAEFEGLKEVFNEERPEKVGFPDFQHIAMGSIKSQIGHTKAAAGIAGLIKTTLALHHKVLPPTLNIDNPNPKLEIEKTPFYLNTDARPWITNGEPRRAGVSAFGFGGTNFHYVLEEFQAVHDSQYRMHKTPQVVFLAAQNPQELDKICKELLAELETEGAANRHRTLVLDSRNNTIPANHARLGFVTSSVEESIEMLGHGISSLESKSDKSEWSVKGVVYREKAMETKGKVVALFSGQGSQYMNMCQELFFNFPTMSEPYSALDAEFTEENGANGTSPKPLSDIVFPITAFNDELKESQQAQLQNTENAQPAIGGISAGLFRTLKKAGFELDFAAGHSFGELTALWAAGVIEEKDYYKLACARGRAMAAPDDPNFDAGSMLAVMGKVDNLEEDIKDFPDVVMANLNSKKQVVLAGPTDAILKAQDALKEMKYTVVKLPVSAAFHTTLVGHAQKPFAEAIRSVKFQKPNCPVYSNATAKAYPTSPKAIQKRLEEHILNSVRFREEIENIHNDGGRLFVEFGPKNVLTKLVDNVLSGKDYNAIALNENPKKGSDLQFRDALVKLCVAGLPLQNFDPYGIPEAEVTKKAGMGIKLNGTNYVSEATRKAFEDAMNDGFKVKLPGGSGNNNSTPVVTNSAPKPNLERTSGIAAETVKQSETKTVSTTVVVAPKTVQKTQTSYPTMSQANPSNNAPVSPTSAGAAETLGTLERSLAGFYQHQNQTLEVHQQYLDQQSEYSRTVYQLLQQQINLVSQGAQLPVGMDQHMQMFHAHQGETLRVHEQYLVQQSQQAQTALQITQQQFTGEYQPIATAAPVTKTAPVQIPAQPAPAQIAAPAPPVAAPQPPAPAPVQAAPAPAPKPAAPAPVQQSVAAPSAPETGITAEQVTQAMMVVVSEKTGYPEEMLELGMDMESDLGIDSIKRVEILGSLQDSLPGLPEIQGDDLAEMRTLGQIVEHVQTLIPAGGSSAAAPSAAPAAPAVAVSTTDVTAVMMTIVSEKTGYPEEMLELSMDMESDLGIDSIKRVEILGSVQDRVPELPEIPGDELAEMRTLGQIVDHLKSKFSASASETPAAPAPAATSTASSSSVDAGTALMNIISEKTGYPTEMLELSMDLEADLGIDSIKRVEIMWSLQEQYPELPQIGGNEVGELRTVGQIAEYIQNLMPAAAPVAQTSAAPANGNGSAKSAGNGSGNGSSAAGSQNEIADALLSIIGEKTGYPPEMLELNMDMEADLGIDSIKRVEIMWSLQEKLPHLPQVSGSEMGELRTLQQIADHLNALAPSSDSKGTAIIPPPVSDSADSVKKNS